MVTNYLAHVLTEGSLTCWTEDGHSSLVGSVENSTRECMSNSGLPALHDLSSGSYLWASSLRLHLLPTRPLLMHPIHLLGILPSFILYTTLEGHGDELSCETSRYLRLTLPTICLQLSVTLCAVSRFTCFHLHKVSKGLPSYTLRTGPGRRDGRDPYRVITCVPLIVVFGVGTQLARRPVLTSRPNAGAGGGCYLVSFKVGMRQGRVTLPCKSLRGVRAPNTRALALPAFVSVHLADLLKLD